MIRKITPEQAAYIMGCSSQFIRVGLQRGLLDIGNAVKMSSIWTYNISPGKLAARQGMTLDELESEVNQYEQKRNTYQGFTDCQW